MDYKHEFGKNGENIGIEYLKQNGFQILEKNFCCKQGEIDIIAKEKNEIVFIEVKSRTSANYGKPIEAVGYMKKNHIYNVAEYYIYLNKIENLFFRFDVIEILYKKNKYYVKHTRQVEIEEKMFRR